MLLLATNGIVLAAEKKQKSILYDESTVSKVILFVLIGKGIMFKTGLFSKEAFGEA